MADQDPEFKYRVAQGFDYDSIEWFNGDQWVHERLESVVETLNYSERSYATLSAENERLRKAIKTMSEYAMWLAATYSNGSSHSNNLLSISSKLESVLLAGKNEA